MEIASAFVFDSVNKMFDSADDVFDTDRLSWAGAQMLGVENRTSLVIFAQPHVEVRPKRYEVFGARC